MVSREQLEIASVSLVRNAYSKTAIGNSRLFVEGIANYIYVSDCSEKLRSWYYIYICTDWLRIHREINGSIILRIVRLADDAPKMKRNFIAIQLRFALARKIGCCASKNSIFFNDSGQRNASRNFTTIRHAGTIDGIVRREPKVARAILEHTEITRNHMTPEIQLFLLTPNCALYHMPYERVLEEEEKRNAFFEPFWSIYWPGGQALARFILDEGRNFVSSCRVVLDVGAGCGATAIAAKLVGARRVIANDIDKVACTAISMNALLNHVDVEVSQENLLYGSPEKSTDAIFIGDLLYDEEIADVLIPWLEKARQNGTRIYLGDPGRHGLTNGLTKRLKLLKQYSLPEDVRKENYGYDKGYVWEFSG